MDIGQTIRRVLTLIVVGIALVGVALVGRASDAEALPAAETAPRLSVVGQSFFLDGTSALNIQMQLTGAAINPVTTTPTSDPTLPAPGPSLIISAFEPITDPAAITGTPSGSLTGSVTVPLAAIASNADDGLNIDLKLPIIPDPGSDWSLQPLNIVNPGLYPLEIRVVDGGTVASTVTFVDRTSTPIRPEDQLAAGIIVAIREIGPAPDESERAAARADLERLIELTDLTDLPLTVMLPPSVIDNVLVDDLELQRRVTTALGGQTVLGAPSFALEPDAAIGAKITDDLRAAWVSGIAKLQANLPESTVDTSTMLIDAPISGAGVDLLHEIGMRLAIVPNTVYRSADGEIGDFTDPGLLVELQTTNTTPIPAAVGSPALNLLDTVNPSTDPATPDQAAAIDATPTERAIRLLANLTAQQSVPSTNSRSVFLMTPEVGVPDPAVIAAIAASATTGESMSESSGESANSSSLGPIKFAPVSELAGRTQSHIVDGKPVTISWQVEPVDVIGNRLTHVAAAETAVRKSVSMLPAEDPRRENWVLRVRSAESTRLTDQEAGQLIADSLAQAEQLRQAVPPPEPFEFTLTGADTTLRFQLTNNAATPLDVLFLLKSDRLIAPERTTIRLTPNSVTDVPIQVSARSNGSASVQVQVVTPDGLPLFAPVEMNGRVTTFGGIGNLITVGALLVLATWWLTFLGRRRRAGLGPAADNATGDNTPADTATGDTATGDDAQIETS